MKHVIIHLATKNDTNGNPRRLFLEIDIISGNVVKVINEGYRGKPESLMGAGIYSLQDIRFNVAPNEYNKWVKFGKEKNIYEY